MPSSVPLLAGSYIESLLDDCALIETAYHINNRNPLGSAAGYCSTLGLDRDRTARLLGFDGSRNCIYVQARHKHMATVVFPATSVMKTLDRMASDLILFTTTEFGFFSLPDRFCTGSSIMPQKKNYDLLELIRGHAAHVHSLMYRIDMTGAKLTSGYHRDFQLTKGPLMEAMRTALRCLAMMEVIVRNLEVNGEAMRLAMTSDLFATDAAYRLVSEGRPFRDAYHTVACALSELTIPEDLGKGRPFLAFIDFGPLIDERKGRLPGGG
jgi:argininosuccinate lyase